MVWCVAWCAHALAPLTNNQNQTNEQPNNNSMPQERLVRGMSGRGSTTPHFMGCCVCHHVSSWQRGKKYTVLILMYSCFVMVPGVKWQICHWSSPMSKYVLVNCKNNADHVTNHKKYCQTHHKSQYFVICSIHDLSCTIVTIITTTNHILFWSLQTHKKWGYLTISWQTRDKQDGGEAKRTRGGGASKVGGVSRGQEVVVARQETMHQPAIEQEANRRRGTSGQEAVACQEVEVADWEDKRWQQWHNKRQRNNQPANKRQRGE